MISKLGRLDIVVSNAARQQHPGSIADITSESFDATIKTNIYATFWLTKAALEHLGRDDAIIIATSEQAYDPSKDIIDYSLTKAAGMNSIKSMAKQLGRVVFESTG